MKDERHPPVLVACSFHRSASTYCCISKKAPRKEQGIFSKLLELASGLTGLYQHTLRGHGGKDPGESAGVHDLRESSRRGFPGENRDSGITITYDVWRSVEDTANTKTGKETDFVGSE
jgi:hypothetical protein